jgi:hypothetical protein
LLFSYTSFYALLFLSGTGKPVRNKKKGMVYRCDPLRRYRRTPSETRLAIASNPGDCAFVAVAGGTVAAVVAGTAVTAVASGVRPVENSFITPVVIVTGADRSW